MHNKLINAARCCTAVFAAWLFISPGLSFAQDMQQSNALPPAPDLDVTIEYYNRELSTDGVLHESSYRETMLRRNGHVWTQRVLPDNAKNDATHANHEHKDFNYITLPRHVKYDGSKTTVEFIDTQEHQVIYIAPTEYENINFDGSWLNAYYLINPQYIATMPVSSRPVTSADSQWYELNKKELFQRVLWDKKMNIPLIIETGDKAGTFMQRVKIQRSTKLAKSLPWNKLQGYTQKEYSDFLD
jgi:hypothetical protein